MPDPFYLEIIQRLQGHLDPIVFEACMADLLREVYSSLVPVPGGGDSGRDGAIADGLGQPFPLICTTSKTVLNNLKKNLNSYIRSGDIRRKVVLATSQSLTPRRLKNLYSAAEALGFELIQVHAQEDLANRLYRNPRWCRELLNLVGLPSSLSIIPHSGRPGIELPLFKREGDFQWLENSHSDQILVGQPGVGKTFLLYHFAKAGRGLFVVSRDIHAIAEDIRRQNAQVLIIDDAGEKLDLIAELVRYRQEVEGVFRIITSCWPGQVDGVYRYLSNPEIRELRLFNRDDVYALFRDVLNIRAPNNVMCELVTQSAGRPGLAVILGSLWSKGDRSRIVSGEILLEEILRFSSDPGQTKVVLGGFALGGESGMAQIVVSEVLGVPLLELQSLLSRIAVGGVIEITNHDHVVVRFHPLRHALVKEAFWGRIPIPVDRVNRLIAEAPNSRECIRTLIGARARGGPIPEGLIRTLIESLPRYGRANILSLYASLGREEALWAWRVDQEKALEEARSFLVNIPDVILPHLFEKCLSDDRPTASNPDHPLRQIQDWLDAPQTIEEFVFSRRNLLDQALLWGEQDGHHIVTQKVICSAFTLQLQRVDPHPGEGDQIVVTQGLIPLEIIRFLVGQWPRVLDWLRNCSVFDWKTIAFMIDEWLYPGHPRVEIPEEWRQTALQFGTQMIRDLLPFMEEHPGVRGWAQHNNELLNLGLQIQLDSDFEAIYPSIRNHDIDASIQAAQEQLPGIARRWSAMNPDDINRRLALYDEEVSLHLQMRFNLRESLKALLND